DQHRLLGIDGAGRGSGGPRPSLPGLHRGPAAHGLCRLQGDLPPLPARASGRGGGRRRVRGPPVPRVAAGREPAARAEGADGDADDGERGTFSFPQRKESSVMTTTTTLRRTPLYDVHKSLGAKLVPFAGWEMPVQYPTGILAEHNAVRTGVGVFDVSHMGEFEITGPD